ncbi:MAG: galactosyldiacylglycerol synthase [Acidobacteria bacterium]|nr:MAG: galactosyldiacylglycerol synthase [Acidobacteriota bacterium]
MPRESPRLRIVFFDAGGGHRNAANAIKTVIEQQQRPWQVELLNLQDLLDSIDPLQKIAKIRLQDGYNLLLRKGWTRFTPQLLMVLHGMIRMWHYPVVRALEEYWRENRADVVLSVIPNFNRALAQSIRKAIPEARFVTLITDFADYPPHFWIEKESQYVICGTERAVAQAIALGHRRNAIFATSGMVLNPRFYNSLKLDRQAERQKLGLHPDWPTALILFGGHGSPAMLKIARALQQSPAQLQLILICGHSETLAAELRRLPATKPMFVEGFTKQVDYYMSLADFFIGKPGPGSIAEALHFGLPVIVERNASTMPQERYNTEWVEEHEAGIVLKSFDEIETAVQRLLDDSMLEHLRSKVATHKNRALDEAVDILAKFMDDVPERQSVFAEPAAW